MCSILVWRPQLTSLTPHAAYYRGAMGILLVYDVTDEASFTNIRNWMKNIEQHASDNVVKVLVGNKSDMDESKRAVPYSRGQVRCWLYAGPGYSFPCSSFGGRLCVNCGKGIEDGLGLCLGACREGSEVVPWSGQGRKPH
jgi:hypothetical protein